MIATHFVFVNMNYIEFATVIGTICHIEFCLSLNSLCAGNEQLNMKKYVYDEKYIFIYWFVN